MTVVEPRTVHEHDGDPSLEQDLADLRAALAEPPVPGAPGRPHRGLPGPAHPGAAVQPPRHPVAHDALRHPRPGARRRRRPRLGWASPGEGRPAPAPGGPHGRRARRPARRHRGARQARRRVRRRRRCRRRAGQRQGCRGGRRRHGGHAALRPRASRPSASCRSSSGSRSARSATSCSSSCRWRCCSASSSPGCSRPSSCSAAPTCASRAPRRSGRSWPTTTAGTTPPPRSRGPRPRRRWCAARCAPTSSSPPRSWSSP